MERLSTGKRINSAADDAAGVAITSRLTSAIRGINQSIRNTMDAQSFIDTAEGGLQETEAILQRIRELAVQAASDTNSSSDRAALDAEATALLAEMEGIVDNIGWAGKQIKYDELWMFQVGYGGVPSEYDARSFGEFDDSPERIMMSQGLDENGWGPSPGSVLPVSLDVLLNLDYPHSLSLTSRSDATSAISTMDTAIQNLNSQRNVIGALSNRMDHIVANNTNTAINIAKSISRIEDADFAAETTNLAKQQILQQAAIAMLSQANVSKQNILTLLNV